MNDHNKFEGLPQSEPMQLTVDTSLRFTKLSPDGSSVKIPSAQTSIRKPKAKLVCPICHRQFQVAHHLEIHQRNHTGERPFKCKECDAQFACKNRLVLHTRKHTGERPYMCALCHQKFLQSAHLKVHMKRHSSEKPFKCTQCSKSFKFQQSLKIHILEHSDKWEFKCETCDKLFTTALKLRKHSVVHSDKKLHKCDKCGKQFKDASYIAKHQSQFCGNDGYKNRWKNKPIIPKARRLKAKLAKETDSSNKISLPRGRPKGSKNKKNRRRKKQKVQLTSESDAEFEDFLRGDKTDEAANEGQSEKIYSADKDPPFSLDDMMDNNEIDTSIGYIDLSFKSLQNSLNFKHNEVAIVSDHCHSLRKYHDKPDTMKVSNALIKSEAPVSVKENFVAVSECCVSSSSPVSICLPSVMLAESELRQSSASQECPSSSVVTCASNSSLVEFHNNENLKPTAMNQGEVRSSLQPASSRCSTGPHQPGKENMASFGHPTLLMKPYPSEQLLQPYSEQKQQHEATRPPQLQQDAAKDREDLHRRNMVQQQQSQLVEQQQVSEAKFEHRHKEQELPSVHGIQEQQMLSDQHSSTQPLMNGSHSLPLSLGQSVLNKTTGMNTSQCQHKGENPVQIHPLIHMSDHIFDDQSGSSNLSQMNFANSFPLQSSQSHLDSNSLMNYSYADNVFSLSVMAGSYDSNLPVEMHDNAQNLPLSLDLSVHNNLENMSQNPQNLSLPHNLQHSMSAVAEGINSGAAQNLALPHTYAIPQSTTGVAHNLSSPPPFNSHAHPQTSMPYDLSLIHHNAFSQNLGNASDDHAQVQNYSRVNSNVMGSNLNNFSLSQNLCSLHNSSSLLQNLTSLPLSLNKSSQNLNSLPQNLSTMSDALAPLALNLPLLQPESGPQNLTAHRLTSLPQNLSAFSQYLPQSIPQNLSVQNDFSGSYSSNSNQYMLSNTVHDLSTPQNLSNQTNVNHISTAQLAEELHQPQNLSQNQMAQPENLSLPQNLSVQAAEKKNSCMAQPQNLCVTSSAVIAHKVMPLQRSACHQGSLNSNTFNSSSSMVQNLSNVDVADRHMRAESSRPLSSRLDSVPTNLNSSMSSGAIHPCTGHPNTASNNHFNVQQNLLVPASFNTNMDMALALTCSLSDDQNQKFGIPQNLSHPGKLKQYIQDLSCSSKLNSAPDNIPQNLSLDSQPQNLSESLPQNLSSSSKSHGAYGSSPIISQPYLAQPQNLTSSQNWHI